MLTRPADLADGEVHDALGGWGLDVASVDHAPVGFGSHHWWVTTRDGSRWFATADDLRTRRVDTDEPLTVPLSRLTAALGTAADARHSTDLLAGMEPIDELLRASGQYGPRVPVPDDAPPHERLMAFVGRDPARRP